MKLVLFYPCVVKKNFLDIFSLQKGNKTVITQSTTCVITFPVAYLYNKITLWDHTGKSGIYLGHFLLEFLVIFEHARCRGVIIMTYTGSLLLSVFIASSMSGWSGCFYLSVWQTGVCLIYIVAWPKVKVTLSDIPFCLHFFFLSQILA